MNFTEVERVIVDLGVLSSVKREDKISTHDQDYMSVQEPIPIWTPLMRWFYGDKKTKTTDRLKELINKTDNFLQDPRLRPDHREQLIEQLVRACPGMSNQMYTYTKNKVQYEQLRLIMVQVINILKREGQDVSSLQSHLPHAISQPPPVAVPSPQPRTQPTISAPIPPPQFSVFSRSPAQPPLPPFSQPFASGDQDVFYRPARLGEPTFDSRTEDAHYEEDMSDME